MYRYSLVDSCVHCVRGCSTSRTEGILPTPVDVVSERRKARNVNSRSSSNSLVLPSPNRPCDSAKRMPWTGLTEGWCSTMSLMRLSRCRAVSKSPRAGRSKLLRHQHRSFLHLPPHSRHLPRCLPWLGSNLRTCSRDTGPTAPPLESSSGADVARSWLQEFQSKRRSAPLLPSDQDHTHRLRGASRTRVQGRLWIVTSLRGADGRRAKSRRFIQDRLWIACYVVNRRQDKRLV